MRRKSVKLVLTALITASMLPTAAALSADREVVISVLDAQKKPVSDLAPADVIVREDGVAREVLNVRPATSPLTIAVLVDDSAASDAAMADIRNGLQAFFDALTGQHHIALITFGERPTLLLDYTTEKERLKKAGLRVFARPGSGAYFLDALVDASRGLQRREPERPVIVSIMTEGVEFSNRTYEMVLEPLFESRAAFHALVLSGEVSANPANDEIRNRNVVLDQGTRGTGGRRDQLLSSIALAQTLRELASELEHQWVVTYSRPDTLLQPERLEVEAKRADLTVRAPTRIPESRAK
jgi:Ca-activated chloride channel family protein